MYKQIGNAVPVRLALSVADPIAEFAKRKLAEKEKNEYITAQRDEKEERMMA